MAARIAADVRSAVGGRDFPGNWHEFEKFFPTERACIFYLQQVRWPDGFRCSRCGPDRYWLRQSGQLKGTIEVDESFIGVKVVNDHRNSPVLIIGIPQGRRRRRPTLTAGPSRSQTAADEGGQK